MTRRIAAISVMRWGARLAAAAALAALTLPLAADSSTQTLPLAQSWTMTSLLTTTASTSSVCWSQKHAHIEQRSVSISDSMKEAVAASSWVNALPLHRANERLGCGWMANRDEIVAFCLERIAKFKVPKSIDFLPELPRDPNGKLYKRKLRDPYWVGRERAI